MCFSSQADLVGGVVIGVDTVGHCRRPREVALASLPLLLAGHQLVEAFVWWGLQGRVAPAVGRGAMWAYLAFAFGVPAGSLVIWRGAAGLSARFTSLYAVKRSQT